MNKIMVTAIVIVALAVTTVNGAPVADSKLDHGILQNVGDEWQAVSLSQSYDSMVVIATAVYDNTSPPLVTRIRNAAGNSFQVKVQNPGSGSAVTPVSVHYIAVEEGVYTVGGHGIKMEAVKYLSTITDSKTSYVGESRTYQNTYSSPVVMGQVMTANDPRCSVFWSQGESTGEIPSATTLFTGKLVSEDTVQIRENEIVGYIVLESGIGVIDGVNLVAGVGDDTVAGFDDAPPYSYTVPGVAKIGTVVLSNAGRDGADGGWPVLYGAPVGRTIKLAVDEDQVGDSERGHTTEQVAYLIIATALISSDIFSINFYKDDTNGNLTLEEGQAAGFNDWLTTGWKNIEMAHNMAGGLPAFEITSNNDSTATFDLRSARNGGPFAGVRTTLLGDGNGDMMDGHVNATEDPYDGSLIFDIEVSDISMSVYDVIIYMGGNWGDNTGKIIFNGGPVQSFTALKERFDGTFIEIVDGTTPGNYIIFKNVAGESFSVQVWGDGFIHIGPCGIQFGVVDMSAPAVNVGSDWVTWSGEAVTLNDVVAINNDPGEGDLTLAWSADPVAGVTVEFSDARVQKPTVTITKTAPTDRATPVTLTLTATQAGKDPVESSMTIDVYDDACKASLSVGATVIGPADFNANCVTDLEDFAELSAAWLVDFSLEGPTAK